MRVYLLHFCSLRFTGMESGTALHRAFVSEGYLVLQLHIIWYEVDMISKYLTLVAPWATILLVVRPNI